MILSVTTFEYLRHEYSCSESKQRLVDVLPEKITKTPFNLTGEYEIRYPDDFEKFRSEQLVAGDLKRSLVMDTLIEPGDSDMRFFS
jgi:hypothetical protein